MLIGLVTVVPSSETERPWCFFLIFPPSCACSCVEWAVSDTHHAARPSPASSQRANQSPGLGGSAQGFAFWKSSGRYRAGSAPGTGSWAAPGNLLSFPHLAWFSLHEFLLLLFAPLAWPCRWPQSQAFLLGKHKALSSLLLLSSSPTIW